jgi:Zn-dependent M32 family carboxypeptidase
MLDWDQATMMPEGGAAARAGQLSTLEVIRHEMLCSQEMTDLLSLAEDDSQHLDGKQQISSACAAPGVTPRPCRRIWWKLCRSRPVIVK